MAHSNFGMSTKKPPPPPDFTKITQRDSYDGRAEGGSERHTGEVAPEVSQGAWRERVFTPRAVLSREEVREALLAAHRTVAAEVREFAAVPSALRTAWLPVLRQALEQAGGDGLDAWLLSLFSPPGRVAKQPLFGWVVAALEALTKAADAPALEALVQKVVEQIDGAMATKPIKLSFKQLEKVLEGKLEVDELLAVRAASEAQLVARREEVNSAMEQLRDELKTFPGNKPEGMYSNFVRLKTELRVIDTELKRRAGRLTQKLF